MSFSYQKKQVEEVVAYHHLSKHHFNRYAPSLGYLDWATQPDSFRRYAGAKNISLRKIDSDEFLDLSYESVFHAKTDRHCKSDLNIDLISQLFFDSLSLSAWKRAGESRWALRVNPSSGNLHPTESYLLSGPVDSISDKAFVAHYSSDEHILELRCEFDVSLWNEVCKGFPDEVFFIGLSSIYWREAWKYGERAFRYCHHDVGHAIGAISLAASSLGWQSKLIETLSREELSILFGLRDSLGPEAEHPDCLLAITPQAADVNQTEIAKDTIDQLQLLDWQGKANQLSQSHVSWPNLKKIAAVTTKANNEPILFDNPLRNEEKTTEEYTNRSVSFRKMVRQRRSAVAMDGKTSIRREQFYQILKKTLPEENRYPYRTLPWSSKVHFAIFIHRVENLESGLYFLIRDVEQTEYLKRVARSDFLWEKPVGCPENLPLFKLLVADVRVAAKQISCLQDIAAEGCFSLGMITQFQEPLQKYGAWFYPRLYWECGLVGQVLYLEAEAIGIRATGIGCFFDDPMHRDILGIEDLSYQSLYHFTIGSALEDTRIESHPAYID